MFRIHNGLDMGQHLNQSSYRPSNSGHTSRDLLVLYMTNNILKQKMVPVYLSKGMNDVQGLKPRTQSG